MADFINFEAVQDDVIMENDECELAQSVSDNEFIDDEVEIDENIEDYYAFANAVISVDNAMQDSFLKLDSSESYHHEVNNYCDDNYDPDSEQIDEFRDSAKRIEEFKHTLLCPYGMENQDLLIMRFSTPFAISLKIKKTIVKMKISLNKTLKR